MVGVAAFGGKQASRAHFPNGDKTAASTTGSGAQIIANQPAVSRRAAAIDPLGAPL
jgi:hypothetical protein